MSPHMDNQVPDAHTDSNPATINRVPIVSNERFMAKDEKPHCAKEDLEATSIPPADDAPDVVLYSELEIANHVISVDDDPSLNPWTFRAFFLGLGLSAFGGSLGAIISLTVFSSAYYTKQPRSIISNQ